MTSFYVSRRQNNLTWLTDSQTRLLKLVTRLVKRAMFYNILIFLAEKFVRLNTLISETTGSNWPYIFLMDSPFIELGYCLYHAYRFDVTHSPLYLRSELLWTLRMCHIILFQSYSYLPCGRSRSYKCQNKSSKFNVLDENQQTYFIIHIY